MNIEQLKQHIQTGPQHYFHRDQVIELLNKLEPPKKQQNVLTLF